MAKKTNKVAETEATVETTAVEEVVENVTETVEEPKVTKPKTGVVANCEKLNVREKPTTSSSVVGVINKTEKVTIKNSESTDEWLKIKTKSGLEGFCMKKFIEA